MLYKKKVFVVVVTASGVFFRSHFPSLKKWIHSHLVQSCSWDEAILFSWQLPCWCKCVPTNRKWNTLEENNIKHKYKTEEWWHSERGTQGQCWHHLVQWSLPTTPAKKTAHLLKGLLCTQWDSTPEKSLKTSVTAGGLCLVCVCVSHACGAVLWEAHGLHGLSVSPQILKCYSLFARSERVAGMEKPQTCRSSNAIHNFWELQHSPKGPDTIATGTVKVPFPSLKRQRKGEDSRYTDSIFFSFFLFFNQQRLIINYWNTDELGCLFADYEVCQSQNQTSVKQTISPQLQQTQRPLKPKSPEQFLAMKNQWVL